ncbi:hypothetical protein Bpfe_011188 [Biomphalaria pfeifferi]|uniref:Uncharacterized protein n=1 Tax=Biomphalaria pfeifferi TaxID=112525 RepID=A0AAD8FDP7_BIOPF|nr:hypothetical protein Bpfe_011188 [Biomphalaria pfeifferi]
MVSQVKGRRNSPVKEKLPVDLLVKEQLPVDSLVKWCMVRTVAAQTIVSETLGIGVCLNVLWASLVDVTLKKRNVTTIVTANSTECTESNGKRNKKKLQKSVTCLKILYRLYL